MIKHIEVSFFTGYNAVGIIFGFQYGEDCLTLFLGFFGVDIYF